MIQEDLFGRGAFHPKFAMTISEYHEMVETLPFEVQARIIRDPGHFLDLTAAVLESDILLVRHIDRSNGLSPDYTPNDLVRLREVAPDVPVYASDDRLIESAANALLALVRSAADDGIHLAVSSGFRDYPTQEDVYADHITRFGFRSTVQLVAPPGHSEHQLGTTVDFYPVGRRFNDSPQDRWLNEHAGRYGFSMSYPPDLEHITGYLHESWHYRYLGLPAIHLRDRFFGGVQFHLTEFFHRHGDFLQQVLRQ